MKQQRKFLLPGLLLIFVAKFLVWAGGSVLNNFGVNSGAPPYGESESDVPLFTKKNLFYDWERPDGPAKVALQVGHWKNSELPEELKKLRDNSGASGGGDTEWEVNLAIAEKTKSLLEEYEVVVEILPSTIPAKYWADVFLAIHVDGSEDLKKSGFKIAGPWRDVTGNAQELAKIVQEEYQKQTGLDIDPNITRNMRGYYAFSWWRYEHSLHPMTTAIILELGFLSNYSDRLLLVNNLEIPANAIADGIVNYLREKELL